MAKTLYAVSYNGLRAIYPSNTGLIDPRTQQVELGGGMNAGDYFDLSPQDVISGNYQDGSGNSLYTGRYRFVRIAAAATAANIFQGAPAAIAKGTTVAQAVIAAVGTGLTPGTYLVNSSTSGGTAVATAQIVVGASGTIISAAITPNGMGAGFTSTPTFTLTALGGSGASVLAEMNISENIVTSFDSSAISLNNPPRGVFLNYTVPVGQTLAAMIAAGAYVFIQEQGIASVLVNTATATAVGSIAAASTGGVVTTTTGATWVPAALGNTLDLAAANTLVRVELALPVRQG